jgi:hypothetical protein
MKTYLVVGLLAITACSNDDEVGASAVASKTSNIVQDVSTDVSETLESVGDLKTSAALAEALGILSGVLGGEEEEAISSALTSISRGQALHIDGEPHEDDITIEAEEEEESLEDIADGIAEFLEKVVFIEEHVESADDKGATFLVKGSVVCDEETPEDQQGCIDGVDELELRVRVVLSGDDGLDMHLEIAPARYNPLSVELRSGSIAVEVDLADGKSAVEHVLQVIGEDGDLPEVMEGRLRVALSVVDDQSVDISLSILADVRLAMTIEGDYLSLSVGAANPVAFFAADVASGSVGAGVDLGAVDLQLPYGAISEEEDSSISGDVSLHLAGLSFALDLDDGEESVTISNIGLGDERSTLKLDSTELIGIELNANDDRRFTLVAEPTTNGDSAIFTVSPAAHLTLDFNLAAIVDDLDSDTPDFLLADSLGISLSGDGSASIEPVRDAVSGEEFIRVNTGALTLSASSANSDVSVTSGQCLLGRDEENPRQDESHELLRLLEGGDCP